MSRVIPRDAPKNFQLFEHLPGKEEDGTEISSNGVPPRFLHYLAKSLQQDLDICQLAESPGTV